MRRSNLLFFGIPDVSLESWADSEKKVIDLCSQHLKLSVAPSQIERAHRLGKYQSDKCRPVIVKLAFFKDKQRIMEKGKLFKDTDFAVREDFSRQTRTARNKLRAFAKEKNVSFKLNVDRLRIDDITYVYDAEADSITQVPR